MHSLLNSQTRETLFTRLYLVGVKSLSLPRNHSPPNLLPAQPNSQRVLDSCVTKARTKTFTSKPCANSANCSENGKPRTAHHPATAWIRLANPPFPAVS